jgi:hypothetical protein
MTKRAIWRRKYGKNVRGDLHVTYRKGDIYAVITHDFGFVSPDIIEQVEHDLDGFVPYQPSISLQIILRK